MSEMKDSKHMIDRGIAQSAQGSSSLVPMASRGLISFLREQVVEAEWRIARSWAEITAYENAIAAIEKQDRGDAPPETTPHD